MLSVLPSYGDYATICPQQTFTQQAMRQNFPNTNLPAWEIIETFGPTQHGAEGFTVLIPVRSRGVPPGRSTLCSNSYIVLDRTGLSEPFLPPFPSFVSVGLSDNPNRKWTR